METFVILLIVGLFAYGRNVRAGVLAQVGGGSVSVTVQATAAANGAAVQGGIGGGSNVIPNSNGFVPNENEPLILQTGGYAASPNPTVTFEGTPGQAIARSTGGKTLFGNVPGRHHPQPL